MNICWEFLGIWSVLLCVIGACDLVYSCKQKKLCFIVGSIPILLTGGIVLQLVRLIADERIHEPLQGAVFGALFFISGLAGWVSCQNLRWNKTHITPSSIQESFEKLTVGICYYRQGGQCILVNSRMREISNALTGHMLMNGEEFAKRIFSPTYKEAHPLELYPEFSGEADVRVIELQDKSVKAFSRRSVQFGKEQIWELLTTDVTETYGKTKHLQEENERLIHFQKQLKAYNTRIKETVCREEILQAKMNIHDEMNRLLLTTRNALRSGDEQEKEKALEAWRNNALLLCRENSGGNDAQETLRDLSTLADSLGIQWDFQGEVLPEKADELRLFVLAAREALSNAVKHAQAKKLTVRTERMHESDGERGFRIIFENVLPEWENRLPAGEEETVKEMGGLKNQRQKTEAAGGGMTVCKDENFRLELLLKGPAQEV